MVRALLPANTSFGMKTAYSARNGDPARAKEQFYAHLHQKVKQWHCQDSCQCMACCDYARPHPPTLPFSLAQNLLCQLITCGPQVAWWVRSSSVVKGLNTVHPCTIKYFLPTIYPWSHSGKTSDSLWFHKLLAITSFLMFAHMREPEDKPIFDDI